MMNPIDEDVLAFLKQQLKWHKEQDMILEKIEGKLIEMKELAEYRLAYELSVAEVHNLNAQLQKLKVDVLSLEQQLYKGIVH